MGRKSFGCLTVAGAFTALVGLFLLVFCIVMMVWSEAKMDQNREMYAESTSALEEYYADTLLTARYSEILDEMDVAEEMGDSVLYAQLSDSLELYSPPLLQGQKGFSIAGAFLMIPATVGGILLCIGALILIAGLVGMKKRK